MATAVITVANLHFIYNQLNYLRGYVGSSLLNPMEYVLYVIPPPSLEPNQPQEHKEPEPKYVIIENYF
jgi:hypothetical protein